MKIYIKKAEGKKITIPLPLWTIRIGARLPIEKIARKHMKEVDAKYLDLIDWKEMKTLIISLSSEYKGLKLVDIKANDGTQVLIEI